MLIGSSILRQVKSNLDSGENNLDLDLFSQMDVQDSKPEISASLLHFTFILHLTNRPRKGEHIRFHA